MWLLLIIVVAPLSAQEVNFELRSTSESYTWRVKVGENKKVSGFLRLDSTATELRADLEIKSGAASLFISTDVEGQKYTWNSTEQSHHTLILNRNDKLLSRDGFGLQRKFEIGAVGHAPGLSSVCLTISVTSENGNTLHAAAMSQGEETADWSWVVGVSVLLVAGVWLWKRQEPELEDLRIKLL